jgi:hypothetical protein
MSVKPFFLLGRFAHFGPTRCIWPHLGPRLQLLHFGHCEGLEQTKMDFPVCDWETRIPVCDLETWTHVCDLETRIPVCDLETWTPVCDLETRISVCELETRIEICDLATVEFWK